MSMATIASTQLTGCKNTKFTYKTTSNGDVEVSGKISYETLSNYKFLTINYKDGTSVDYIALDKTGVDIKTYYDIQTNKQILTAKVGNQKQKIYSEEISNYQEYKVQNFLVKHKELKDEYSMEEINNYLARYTEEKEKSYTKIKQ